MFADYSFDKKLLVLLGIYILLNVIGNVIAVGFSLLDGVVLSHVNTIRLEQFVASVIIFVGSPYVFFYLTAKPDCSFAQFFKLTRKNGALLGLLTILAWAFLLPIVNYTTQINEQMVLPESLQVIEELMKKMEDLAKELTLDLLRTDSFFMFLINLIVIAAAPAIGEEMMFRGALQKTLQEKMNPWIAIFITSFIFSAMHLQFYGFIPRFILSVFLGMLYYFSKSIKLNMLAHFCNNAIAVAAFYICSLAKVPIEDTPAETLGKGDLEIVAVSALFFGGIMWMIYKYAKHKEDTETMRRNAFPEENN